MSWHYLENGKIVGPISDKEFQTRRTSMDPVTMVWRDGMKEWQRLESVPLEHQTGDVKRRHLTPARRPADPTPAPPVIVTVSPYAGFGSRLGAFLIDKAIFIFGLGYFTGGAWSMFHTWSWQWHMDSMTDWRDLLAPTFSGMSLMLLEFAYEVMMTAEFEATLGKMVFGLKVRHNGERLNYGRSMARVLAKKLSGYICGIGYLMVLWDKEQRGLHDHICSTRVFKN